MKRLLLFLLILNSLTGRAQLTNGSIAPDFMLFDLNGNKTSLYHYLDEGKTVYLDLFAAHCPSCWSYHNTHALRDLYNQYGPNGTDEVMVIAIELDQANGYNEFYGLSGATAGDWVTDTPYPICNPECADYGQFVSDYDVTYYPVIYAICPDGKITLIGTQTTADLYNHVSTCAVSVSEKADIPMPSVFFNSGFIYIEGLDPQKKYSLNVYNMMGKTIIESSDLSRLVPMNANAAEIYIYQLSDESGNTVSGKFFVE